MLEHFKFLKANTKVTPKMTIPSPSVMHFRGGRQAISKEAYPEMGAYFDDLAKLYGKAIKAFYDAGCRYLQLDDTVWAYLCSKEQLEQARARGEDADKLAGIYAKIDQHGAEIEARRHDHHHPRLPRQLPLHLDLGRRLRAGGRAAAGRRRLRRLLPRVRHRARRRARAAALPAQGQEAGGRRPRHLQETGRWRRRTTSSAGSTRRRSTRPLEQLCLSPQCGFASTEEGNVLTEEQQWAKLKMIVDISREVWK